MDRDGRKIAQIQERRCEEAMRFRKSVTICKGVRVNFSKSGTSLTVGPRGASINFGKNGTYLNTGIPGTGLYDRQKIGGGKKKAPSQRRQKAGAGTTMYPEPVGDFRLEYKTDGTVDIYNPETGELILDPSVIRKIRRTPEYNEGVAKLAAKLLREENEQTEEILNIYKKSCEVYSTEAYEKQLAEMRPQQAAECEPYPVPQPTKDELAAKLRAEAVTSIKTMKFWKKDEMVEEYVQERLRQRLADSLIEWKKDKDAFDQKEQARMDAENQQYQEEYQRQKKHLQKLLANDPQTIDQNLNSWVEGAEMPFEFHIDYDLQGDSLQVDLDLPEIEDMPQTYAQKLTSGIVKVKDKSQAKVRSDYYQCVLGLGLCIATHFFSLAPGVQMIVMSAYTQRRDNTGRLKDDYIYSVKFRREDMMNMDFKKDVDELFFKNENVCNVLHDKSFKAIVPF